MNTNHANSNPFGSFSTLRIEKYKQASGETFELRVWGPKAGSYPLRLPVVFCVHSLGLSSACFAQLGEHMQRRHPGGMMRPHTMMMPRPEQPSDLHLPVVAPDLRCHGGSGPSSGGEETLTLERLAADTADLLAHAQSAIYPDSPFLVVGHGLGAAIAARALTLRPQLLARVSGVVSLEGAAALATPSAESFQRTRPADFASAKDAETWFLQHGGMTTATGAAEVVPSLLRRRGSDDRWVWRTDLSKVRQPLSEWADDSAFAALPKPKMLLVAKPFPKEQPPLSLETPPQAPLTCHSLQGLCADASHFLASDATETVALELQSYVQLSL